MISSLLLAQNPKFWTNPKTFDPTRFTEGADAIKPYTFLPFIEGPRMCLGQFLSLLESKIVLGLLFREYDITRVGGMEGERHRYMVPIIPKEGVVVRCVRTRR